MKRAEKAALIVLPAEAFIRRILALYTLTMSKISSINYVSSKHDKFKLPANWKIIVESVNGDPINVVMAIGFDLELKVIETESPLEFNFVAEHFTALISTTTPSAIIKAEKWSDIYGEFRKIGRFKGEAIGKFSFHPFSSVRSSSGTSF